MKKSIGIGLMGLGVVGGGVAKALLEKDRTITEEVGRPLVLSKVLVRDMVKSRSVQVDSRLLTLDPREILADPEIHIVIEVIGGEHPGER